MVTEIELLREDIPRLEKKFGKDNLFVGLLKAQLDFLQNQAGHTKQRGQKHLEVLNFIQANTREREANSKKQH